MRQKNKYECNLWLLLKKHKKRRSDFSLRRPYFMVFS
jgi:hypothetical protein